MRAPSGQPVYPLAPGVGQLPVEPPLFRVAEPARLSHAVRGPGEQHLVAVQGLLRHRLEVERRVGRYPLVDRGAKASVASGGGWPTFQNAASRPQGRSTCAAFVAPMAASTQCQACLAMTASKLRLAGSQASSVATSTSTPLRRAKAAFARVSCATILSAASLPSA